MAVFFSHKCKVLFFFQNFDSMDYKKGKTIKKLNLRTHKIEFKCVYYNFQMQQKQQRQQHITQRNTAIICHSQKFDVNFHLWLISLEMF